MSLSRATGKKEERHGFTVNATFRKVWIEPILIAFILMVLIKTFVVQPFKIPSGSMEDTLLVGDQLVAAKFLYGTKIPLWLIPRFNRGITGKSRTRILKIRDPRPGDVIVFRYPADPSKDFIKRCIATGGQTIEIRNKQIFVDGVQQKRPEHAKYIDHTMYPARTGPRDNYPPFVVPPGHVFVMGDNRDNSNDSRYWGTVSVESIKGKALFLYWSWNSETPVYDLIHRIRWNRLFARVR